MNLLTQILAALAKPLKWWVVIAPWEQGVRVRLGKTAILLLPGPHFRIPFVDRVYTQSVRLRTITETNQTASTKDGKVMVFSASIQFAVSDMLVLYNSVANLEHTLGMIAQAEAAAFVYCHPGEAIRPDALERYVNEAIVSCCKWGLTHLRYRLVGYAFMRTYRIVMNDYRTGSGLFDLDKENAGEQ